MATPKDYATGSAAANGVIQVDLGHVPGFIRRQIPQDQIKPFCDAIAKAIIDAVDKERAGA